jgi:DNA-binding GntR family transcriptional regulator
MGSKIVRILEGAPGELFTEKALAKRAGASRADVSAALAALVAARKILKTRIECLPLVLYKAKAA